MRHRDLWERLIHAEAPAALSPALFTDRARRQQTPMWARARGAWVWDTKGRRYLDFVAGFGVASVGHANPRVVRAVRRQAGRLLHGFGDVHPHEGRARLAERLARLAPWRDARVLWAQSGSEAVELAWKTAALATGKPGVLAFEGGYHGDSGLALSLSGWPALRKPFASLLPRHTVWAPYGDAETALALADRRGQEIGAILVEPIQGRGGHVIAPPGFLAALARGARQRGWLLVADEIFTGLGRTGRRFAFEHERVTPDLVCVGKTLAGGMPLAAVLAPRKILAAWKKVDTGSEAPVASTFMAHPVACAAAEAALDEIESKRLVARSARLGALALRRLRAMARRHHKIVNVRGRGLLIGIELAGAPDARRIVEAALDRSLILLMGGVRGNVVTLSPPLTLSTGELADGLERIESALDEALGPSLGRGRQNRKRVG
ncbi:MAG TPA: aminotransferase class III-fold pyridoxal phosphate-dependent enzyme [Candidatus Eisenbacteria bacterium]|nr:aminotransferase class III-fold pyridoxal phosphate-dependent enzyme [Candidatus Eisenbacteria bacterium]